MSALPHDPANDTPRPGRALAALLLLVPAPTLGVLAAMWWEPTRGTMTGQGIYVAAKVWILLVPAAWHVIIDRGRIGVSRPTSGGIVAGLAWGVAIAAAILAGYWLIGRSIVDTATLREAAAANNVDKPLNYIGLAFGLTFFNALLEEYVWRWFVYRKCEALVPAKPAVALSALLFTVHHLLALKSQMDWAPTMVACVGIFVGGCVWSGLFRRYRSIWPGYVSHILADAAVFTVGWMLLFAE